MANFTVDYEPAIGLIRCAGDGFMSVADIKQHHAAALAAITKAQRDFGHAKMLVHAIGSKVRSAEVMAEVEATMWPMTDAQDRLAIIVTSSLAKMQARGTIETDQVQALLSVSAALTWRIADRQAALAASA